MFTASAAKSLVSRLKLAGTWACFRFLRGCEGLLPRALLSFLLWPPMAVWDLLQVRQRKVLTAWRRFPNVWQPKPGPFFLRHCLKLSHPQAIYVWPDRLPTERWLSRCSLEGGSELIGSRKGDRGVILASMHFGPFETIPYWLRAHGIVTTTVRGCPAPDHLRSLTKYHHALSAPADVPVFLAARELAPLPRFAHIEQIVGPGRRLLVNVDVDRGPQFYLPFGDRLFRMATGAIRLAAMANAELIPCLIRETSTWRFTIFFGTPVPQHYLGASPDLQAVGAHLLGEFSKVVTRYPEQCRSRLLSAIFPLPANGASDPSAVAQAA